MLKIGKSDCSLVLEDIYNGTSVFGVPSYMEDVQSIQSITINRLESCCESTVASTFTIITAPFDLDFDILSCPGDNCANDGEKLSITVGDTTNISTYLWELERSSSVIWSGSSATEDVCVSLTAGNSILTGDIIRLTVTLTDGTIIVRTKIVDTGDVQSCIYTYSQATTTVSNRPFNVDNDNNIVLNTTGWGDSDGVYSITYTMNYTDTDGNPQVETGQVCQLADCQLVCDLATYYANETTNEDYDDIVFAEKLYEAIERLITCDFCCTACKLYGILTEKINETEVLCYACE